MRQRRSILLIHPNFLWGGSEVVMLYILKALYKKYDVTIFCNLNIKKNLIKIKKVFDINLEENFFNIRLSKFNTNYPRLNKNLSTRFIKSELTDFDMYLTTQGFINLNCKSFHYIHYPPKSYLSKKQKAYTRDSLISKLKNSILDFISNTKKYDSSQKNHKFICNSNWTLRGLKKEKNIKSSNISVIYPPVTLLNYNKNKKELNSFIAISRIVPEKNITDIIYILDELWKENKDIKSTIIGSTSEMQLEYLNKIERMVSERDHIKLKKNVSRNTMVRELTKSQFGIHAMKNEHFGISNIEMFSAGVIPFIPNEGGQVEIHPLKECIYKNNKDAIKKIKEFFKINPRELDLLSLRLSEYSLKFSNKKFVKNIQNHIKENA